MSVDPIGIGLGIAGLLLAFKGAVDGYLLLDSFLDRDGGSKDLAIGYHVEKCVLEDWGNLNNIYASREEDCRLYHTSDSKRELVANILARINTLHETADKYVEQHAGGHGLLTLSTKLSEKSCSGLAFLQRGSVEVQELTQRQKHKKTKRRIQWSIKNKEKFAGVVSQLRRHNTDLNRLLSNTDLQTLKSTLPFHILANMDNEAAIERLRDMENDRILVKHAANLKILQLDQTKVQPAARIKLEDISPTPLLAKRERISVGTLQFKRIWVEWKEFDDDLSDEQQSLVRNRLKTLSGILSTALNPALRIPKHLGIVQHEELYGSDTRSWLGLVYAMPEFSTSGQPESLMRVMSTCTEPPLGDKFNFAAQLASALAIFHSSNWLHKALRANNILFFQGPARNNEPYPSIIDPYITGFDAARPNDTVSIEIRPSGKGELDYYYHPEVRNGAFKIFDWYSFGVILLEMAYWKPLSVVLKEEVPLDRQQDLEAIRDVMLDSVDNLHAMTGSLYANVVELCLSCSLPSDDTEMALVVATEVVKVLARLRA